MFQAMRLAALLHKVQSMDPRVVSAKEVLEMATIGGAKVLGLGNQIGSLEAGKRADFIVVDRDLLTCPIDDFKATRVMETWVEGREVFRRLGR